MVAKRVSHSTRPPRLGRWFRRSSLHRPTHAAVPGPSRLTPPFIFLEDDISLEIAREVESLRDGWSTAAGPNRGFSWPANRAHEAEGTASFLGRGRAAQVPRLGWSCPSRGTPRPAGRSHVAPTLGLTGAVPTGTTPECFLVWVDGREGDA